MYCFITLSLYIAITAFPFSLSQMEFHFLNCLCHFSEQFSHNFICACMVHESNKTNQLMVFKENTFCAYSLRMLAFHLV